MAWDLTMLDIQTMPDIQHVDGGMLPPKTIVDAAEVGGFHDVCSTDANDFKRWLKRLPPDQSTEAWRATMWTRALPSTRSRAVCNMLLSDRTDDL